MRDRNGEEWGRVGLKSLNQFPPRPASSHGAGLKSSPITITLLLWGRKNPCEVEKIAISKHGTPISLIIYY